jgi:polyisoprenyl-phosphate glycosyltransferase
MTHCDISIVVPCFNEEASLAKTVPAIQEALRGLTDSYEILVVDDGSVDKTFCIVREYMKRNGRIRGFRFTRNFGKEAAIYAGLRYSRGHAVVIIDADSQHPPALLRDLFRYWKEEGYDIVETVKSYSGGCGFLSKLRSKIFNRIMSTLTGFDMQGASDYKLLDRRAVQAIVQLSERNRLFRGLTKWTGYRTKQLHFEVPARIAGKSKWSLFGLVRLSVSAITAFSYVPLHLITILGSLTLVMSFILILQTLYNKLSGQAVSGFATVIILNLILSSVVMISLGIIGIYISNIYSELKGRPPYLIEETTDEIADRDESAGSKRDPRAQ